MTSRDVLAELDRLDHLVADLLLLARADEHGLRVRSVDVDLEDLVDNAARHAASHADLSLHVRAGNVELAIEDDGPGIPESDRERVFERFVRLDESRTRASGGTGLGLAIAREITAAHGGALSVEAGARGARFVMKLPRAAEGPGAVEQ